jgi:hypothetical protein
MLNVLLLLAVPRRFFQCLDNEGGCGRDDADLGLPILDRQFHCDTKSFPVSCHFGNCETIVRDAIV